MGLHGAVEDWRYGRVRMAAGSHNAAWVMHAGPRADGCKEQQTRTGAATSSRHDFAAIHACTIRHAAMHDTSLGSHNSWGMPERVHYTIKHAANKAQSVPEQNPLSPLPLNPPPPTPSHIPFCPMVVHAARHAWTDPPLPLPPSLTGTFLPHGRL